MGVQQWEHTRAVGLMASTTALRVGRDFMSDRPQGGTVASLKFFGINPSPLHSEGQPSTPPPQGTEGGAGPGPKQPPPPSSHHSPQLEGILA